LTGILILKNLVNYNQLKAKWSKLVPVAVFLKEIYPSVITSDIMPLSVCDMQFSAHEMPFENNSLKAIFMLNVLHHIPDNEQFLQEAQRTLQKGGFIYMIEPANTFFSRFIYKKLPS
jgi:SAM-dependent methyltransferase